MWWRRREDEIDINIYELNARQSNSSQLSICNTTTPRNINKPIVDVERVDDVNSYCLLLLHDSNFTVEVHFQTLSYFSMNFRWQT